MDLFLALHFWTESRIVSFSTFALANTQLPG
jgi:hypothetical protein